MSDASVLVKQASFGDRAIDNESVTGHPAGTAYRQRVEIAGAGLAEIARVKATAPVGGDQGLVVRVLDQCATSTVTAATADTAPVTVLAANAARVGFMLHNASTASMYLKLGTGATSSPGGYSVLIPAGDVYEMPRPTYPGAITAVWSAVNGAASVTELS
jgi:hypothetical protein